MKRNFVLLLLLTGFIITLSALKAPQLGLFVLGNRFFDNQKATVENPAEEWADSVLHTLSIKEKVAQLIFVRAHSNLGEDHVAQVKSYIKNQKIGGLVFFQGTSRKQAELTNTYQRLSEVPLLVAIDAEWGLGMRLSDVTPFPHNLMLGAIPDSSLIFEVGQKIGQQLKRVGAQINFGPDMDINNNPNNPVINDRSFGENKYRVADWGIQYFRGMQQTGIIGVAKHFPGHGDTDMDSHKTLPQINKSMQDLENLELYPFKKAIENGVIGVMTGHLEVPAIDDRPNRPSSVSDRVIHDLLINKMGFKGLVVTDALEMQGVTKYYKNGRAALEAFKAGSDILELPENVPEAITAITNAIDSGEVSEAQLDESVKKILKTKYSTGLTQWKPVDLTNISEDINKGMEELNKKLSKEAITVLNNDNQLLPLPVTEDQKMAIVTIGAGLPSFVEKIRTYNPHIPVLHFPKNSSVAAAGQLAQKIIRNYEAVILAVGGYNRYPASRYGISQSSIELVRQLQEETRSVTMAFGNPYAIQYFPNGPTTVAAYNSSVPMQEAAADLLFGAIEPKGELPVSVGRAFKAGQGLKSFHLPTAKLSYADPSDLGIDPLKLSKIDSLAEEAVRQGATPGCEILAMKNGKVFYQKGFGFLSGHKGNSVGESTIYDMASVTKVLATTLACMKLYDEGKLDLNKPLKTYLPWLEHSNKANILIKDVLLHQAGFIPDFSMKTFLATNRAPDPVIFHHDYDSAYTVPVAQNLYMRQDYLDTVKTIIKNSRLNRNPGYVYSDISFQIMGYIVESLSGMPLDQYVMETYYKPLGMLSTGFNPRRLFPLERIAPTECEKTYRMQCLVGNVHDPRSALTGGVAGHAGLFSTGPDLAVALQMLLNGGVFDGKRYLKPETIELFTSYHSKDSRRGYGWDKTARDQSEFKYAYPSENASPLTYGHTGYTGTAVWTDPQSDFIFIFLSNRVHPNGGNNTTIYKLQTRGKIMDAFYEAMSDKSLQILERG